MFAAVLGWGGFTWRRAEDAITRSISAGDRVDRLELKIAEKYLTKAEFDADMNRLFSTLGEMKADQQRQSDEIRVSQQYLVERIDYHVAEQTKKVDQLQAENERIRRQTQRRRIDD